MSDAETYHHETSQANDKVLKRHERLNALCWRVFEGTEEGKELIALLVEEYIVERPVLVPYYIKELKEHAAGFREGQNEMIRELRKRVQFHQQKLNEVPDD